MPRDSSTMTERERRAFNQALEEAAKMADLYADEAMQMAGDVILMGPPPSKFTAEQFTYGAIRRRRSGQETMASPSNPEREKALWGCVHAGSFHTAQNIAGAIRKLKRGG